MDIDIPTSAPSDNDEILSVGTPEDDDLLMEYQLSPSVCDEGYFERERARKAMRLSELENPLKAPNIFTGKADVRLSQARADQWEAVCAEASKKLASLLAAQLREELGTDAQPPPPQPKTNPTPTAGQVPSLMEVSIPTGIIRRAKHSGLRPPQPSGFHTNNTRRRRRRHGRAPTVQATTTSAAVRSDGAPITTTPQQRPPTIQYRDCRYFLQK